MIIRKELVELMGYSQIIGEYTIVPVRIEADDVNFEVEFQAYNKNKKRATFVRRGKHKNYVFTTSINNVPFTINSDGVIKKVRNIEKN